MTAALAPDADGLRSISGLPAQQALRQAATFVADLMKPDVPGVLGGVDRR